MYKPSAKVCNFDADGFFIDNIVESYGNYLLYEKKYSIHTHVAYLNDISEFREYIRENFDDLNLQLVTFSVIRDWIVFLSELNLTNKTINRKIASLKSFYRFLLKTKQINADPLSKYKSLKTSKTIQIPYSKNEILQLLSNIEFSNDFEGLRDRIIIELLYTTGIRRSELIGLKINDIDLNSKIIKVLGKRNKERLIPLLENVVLLFRDYLLLIEKDNLGNEIYLFQLKNGYKLNETFVYRLINYYLSTVTNKVKKSPHMLRHTFATHMLNEGSDINSVKELLGHSSLASTQVYTHNDLEELKKIHLKSHPRNSEK